MMEKLLQAAVITFLIYLIVGLNSNPGIQTEAGSPLGVQSASIVRAMRRLP